MKKIFKILSFSITFFISFLFINNVYAATANIKIKTNKSTYIVGDTVTATITLSSSQALGSWDFVVKYDSAYLTFQSSNLEGSDQAVNTVYNNTTKSKSYTMKFKVKKAGTTKLSIQSGGEVYAYNESKMTISSNSVSLKAITRTDYENSLSKDNTLKSLSVDGYELTPKFDKNTTSYSLTVPNDVRSIKVNATKNDSKATLHGGGTIKLNEGVNKVSIEVEAENGNSKTYVINVTVAELDPIEVEVDGKTYTIVRKRENMTAPSNYSEAITTIDGEEVPSYESEITGFTLVGLLDSDGNINLYIYKDNNYTLYNEIKFNGVILYSSKIDDIPFDDYKTQKVTIGNEELDGVILEGLNYPLVYGMNVETGKSDWYTFDEKENTLQRYVATEVKKVVANDKYQTLAIILGCTSGLLFIFLIILTIKLSHSKKNINVESKIKEEK